MGSEMCIRDRGEAAGLVDKAAAMKELEGVGKEYDLAVRQLDLQTNVKLAAVNAQRDVGMRQAEAIGGALEHADIDIVGGTDLFVDRIIGATSASKALDQFAGASDATSTMLQPYTSGEKDLVQLLGQTLGGLGPAGLAQLSLVQVLQLVAERLGGSDGAALTELIDGMKGNGLGKIDLASVLK